MQKVDSGGTVNYATDGSDVASPVLADTNATYTPGLSERTGTTSKFYHSDALGSTRGCQGTFDRLTSVTDPNGKLTSYGYDAFGNQTSVTDPTNNTTTTAYNPDGSPSSVTGGTVWLRERTRSWANALHYTFGWLTGTGTDHNIYSDPNSIQVQDMRSCRGADQIRTALRRNRYQPVLRLQGVSTPQAFVNTILQPWNGTQAQVGGFYWKAYRKGNRIHIFVVNTTTFNSGFYHLPGLLLGVDGWDRARWGFGPMGRVSQQFDWWENVPSK